MGKPHRPAVPLTREKVLQHFLICPEHIYCAFEDGEMVATLTNLRTTEAEILRRKSCA